MAHDQERRRAASAGPSKPVSAERPPPIPGRATRDAAQSRDVLLVEDDKLIREQLAELLRFEGFSVVTAENGREALDDLERFTVKVVVLDLMLPVMSGWDFAAALRSMPDLARLPILTITAVANAHRAPGGPVFLKPLSVDSLVRAVSVYARPRA